MKKYQEIFEHSLLMASDGIAKANILMYLAIESEKVLGSGCVVSILLIDKNGLLRNGASPNLPLDYLKAIDGIEPNPLVGTCASAAATGKIVITESFLADDKWSELKHLPLSIGYLGAWSVPIKNKHNFVLGTMGVYEKSAKHPHANDVSGIELLTKAAAHVLALQEQSKINSYYKKYL
jgi:hypothetical protein